MLQHCIQLSEMGFEGSIGDESDVVDEADYAFHVGEEGWHFLLVDVGTNGETHGEALVGVFAPREDHCGETLAWFVELEPWLVLPLVKHDDD